jgi:hypothetical protein
MSFDISVGCRKFYFIFHPKNTLLLRTGPPKNSDVVTRVPQMLKSLKMTGIKNEILFFFWRHVAFCFYSDAT